MLRKVLVVAAVAAIVVFWFSGCKKSSDQSDAEAPKTMVDYEAEAEKEITKETMAEELDKLEKEIEAESGPQL